MIKVMDQLQGQCIYCTLMRKGQIGESITGGLESIGQLYKYNNCFNVEVNQCGNVEYYHQRLKVFFKKVKHCQECGLSQRICQRMETKETKDQLLCEYAKIMLPSIFILHQQERLAAIVEAVGFQGEYDSKDLQEQLNETAREQGLKWESNQMKTQEAIYRKLRVVVRRVRIVKED